jgi:DNA-binding transcriptional LysR family regulator
VLDLNDFRYFAEIVDRGGYTSAAEALGLSTSTLSLRIQQLETELGVTLLVRTSRSVKMTDAGEEFYGHAIATMARAREAEESMRGRQAEAAGIVRYTTAAAISQFAMVGMLGDFLNKYPKVTLIQHIREDFADIVTDRYDVAIRGHTAPLPDSTLVKRKLAEAPWHLFASPAYLARRGEPKTPDELANHSGLFVEISGAPQRWELTQAKDESKTAVATQVAPRLVSTCMLSLKSASIAGIGITALPRYICQDEVRTGALKLILPQWVAAHSTITALMPSRRGTGAAARAFVDHITAAFPAAVDPA